MAAKSEVLGVKELQAVLRQLPLELQKNVMASVARAGGLEVQKSGYAALALAMRSRTPRAEDVVMKRRRSRKEDVQATVDVGPPRNRPQLRWLHTGTQSHIISARVRTSRTRRSRLRADVSSNAVLASKRLGLFFGPSVNHPGQRPTLWLLRAQHGSKDTAFRAMAEAMRKALPKQVKKLASSKYSKTLAGRIAKKFT